MIDYEKLKRKLTESLRRRITMTQKRTGLRSKLSGQALLKRTEEAHQRINEYGKFGRFYTTRGEKPLKTWKCKEGEHIIDIIPFLAGSMHHQVAEGEPTYLLDIWVHQKVGMDENDVVCLARNYNEPCPICEFINAQRLKKDLDEEGEAALKALNPKRRCLYNIICYDSTREQDRGVQLWEVAHFLFEKKILSVARNPRGGGFVPFSSPDNGRSIYFEREGSGITNTQYLGHKFIERQDRIPDEILEDAYILDELIIKLTYEELKEALLGGLAKPEKSSEPVKGDSIPDDTNQVAQRMEAANRGRTQGEGPTGQRRKAPLKSPAQRQRSSGSGGEGKLASGQQGAATQQRRPTGGGRSGGGKQPAAGQRQRQAPTQRRKKP
jgi:hypothetical protein